MVGHLAGYEIVFRIRDGSFDRVDCLHTPSTCTAATQASGTGTLTVTCPRVDRSGSEEARTTPASSISAATTTRRRGAAGSAAIITTLASAASDKAAYSSSSVSATGVTTHEGQV